MVVVLMLIILHIRFCWATYDEKMKIPEWSEDEFQKWLNGQGLIQPVGTAAALSRSSNDETALLVEYNIYSSKCEMGCTISSRKPTADIQKAIDHGKPFKVIIHGWLSSDNSSTVENIRKAYTEVGDVNVITVNWEVLAGRYDYTVSARDTYNVGTDLASLIDNIDGNKLARIEDFHIIGHSLGAHVAGAAAKQARRGNRKVERITGLDPAGPGFEFWSKLLIAGRTSELSREQAEFVDIIHTSASTLGYAGNLGHADFFPAGGGHPQPGCWINQVVCSHSRAHEYFAESIYTSNSFWAKKCDSLYNYNSGGCGNNTRTLMGERADPRNTGVYYLNVNSEPPFAETKKKDGTESSKKKRSI